MSRKIILLLLSFLSLKAMDTNKRKRVEDIDLPAAKKARVEQAPVPMEDIAEANQASSSSSSNKTPIISMLIARGSHKNEVEENQLEASLTALMQAVYIKNINAVKKLISIGVDVNEQDSHGRTAFYIASEQGYAHIIKLLLQAKNIDVYKADNDDMTPLAIAVENNHGEAVHEILEALKKEGKRKTIDLADKKSWTPLARAARAGNEEIIKLLLVAGANPTPEITIDSKQVAVGELYKGENKEIAQLIENKKREFNVRSRSFMNCLDFNKQDEARKLLDIGINVNANYSSSTPLHAAVLRQQKDIVKMLIDSKANVNAKDAMDDAPIHMAVSLKGHYGIAQLLIDSKADVNATNMCECVPLHWAACYGYKDIVELLIKSKANVNIKNNYGQTPLDWADHKEIIDILKMQK